MFVATTGITLSTVFGGCLGKPENPGETNKGEPTRTTDKPVSPTAENPTGSPTTTTSPVEGVVIDDIVVRKAVTYESKMGSGGVLAGDGQQYVVASVRADRELTQSEFTFETDDESWAPGLPDTAGAINYAVAGHEGGPVGRNLGGDRSYLAFTLPSPLTVSNPRIRVTGSDGAEWRLSSELRERLAAPSPRFELDNLSVPDEVSQGDPLTVALSVSNISETDGRFLVALYWPTKLIADDDESHIAMREVVAGDDATVSVEIDTRHTTNEPEPVTLSVRGHVTVTRDVQVQDASTPS